MSVGNSDGVTVLSIKLRNNLHYLTFPHVPTVGIFEKKIITSLTLCFDCHKIVLSGMGFGEYSVQIVVHSGLRLSFCLTNIIYPGGGYDMHLVFGLLLKIHQQYCLRPKVSSLRY